MHLQTGTNKAHHTRTRTFLKRFHAHTKIVVCIQGNMNAMWHPNDVVRSILLPHIRFNRDMMLAKDNTPCHAARRTLVMLVTNKRRTLQWPAQRMDLNPSKHVWDILKRNVRAQPLQPNLRELTRVTHQMCHSTTVSSQIHYIKGDSAPCCNCHSRWTYNVLKRN